MRSFLDSNVLVYALDAGAPSKQERAAELIERERKRLVLSTQVLEEFFAVATRKLQRPLSSEDAEAAVRDLAVLPIVQVDVPLIFAAISRSRTDRLNFWDGLIIEAAIVGGADRLYTEDLQHGRRFDSVEIINPFL